MHKLSYYALLYTSAFAFGAGSVSISVRNMGGQGINIWWVPPQGGPRVKQNAKVVVNATRTAINSYEGHQFVVTAARDAAPAAAAADTHASCAFWAGEGECSANPSYMLASCAASCAAVAAEEAELARFFVGTFAESLTLREDGSLEHDSETLRAAIFVSAAWAACAAGEACAAADTCAEKDEAAVAACAAAAVRALVEQKIDELAVERAILADQVVLFPVPPLKSTTPKDGGQTDDNDLERKAALAARAVAAAPAVAASCGASAACAARELGAFAEEFREAVDATRKGIYERNEAIRNASCASDLPTTPYVSEGEWRWDPVSDSEAAALVWRGERPAPGADVSGLVNRSEPPRRFWDLFAPASMPGARITLVDDFVSADECAAIVDSARPRLTAATHAHDGALGHVSKVRDSQQATVKSPRGGMRNLSDPVARVKARTVALANYLSDYALGVDGQEDLMAIQYLEHQQYMLHCDGMCDGGEFMGGGRLATVLMYCDVADAGGATAFPNVNVHVKPKRGQAVYFHFRGPSDTDSTDPWHTEHSGCPVLGGEKWVVTQWLRDGVDADMTASRFSPFGGLL
ncbi:hypothetical protein M885DRAFT_625325 [Pelagophyceae sp. CCMP2097]|nr:hypothetical protein M885DRAFT_625325 [Pelagophyceae sp. CCMP2097]